MAVTGVPGSEKVMKMRLTIDVDYKDGTINRNFTHVVWFNR